MNAEMTRRHAFLLFSSTSNDWQTHWQPHYHCAGCDFQSLDYIPLRDHINQVTLDEQLFLAHETAILCQRL